MIIGRLICSKCGCDCTSLYGFALATRGVIRNQQTQKELAQMKEKYGNEEFYFCWGCTAETFGIKPINKEQTKTIDTAQTVTIGEEKKT